MPPTPAPAPRPTPAAKGERRWHTLTAPPAWRCVDFISDLHLQASEPETAQTWLKYLDDAPFDALFILGDLFEVWVGDDVLKASARDTEHRFIQQACAALHRCAQRRPVYVMHGNRDFLLGPEFEAHTGVTLLPDPCVLQGVEQAWLLTHGDTWCLADQEYLAFRGQVRSTSWQANFLGQPLPDREAVARRLRAHSEERKLQSRIEPGSFEWADVDEELGLDWLRATGCQTLIHGHTHQPQMHAMEGGLQRWVLSDWDAGAHPARAEALRLTEGSHLERVPLMP